MHKKCPNCNNQPKGIGDTLHNFFNKIGVHKAIKKVINGNNCGGCQKRQERLNDLFPYKNSRNNPFS